MDPVLVLDDAPDLEAEMDETRAVLRGHMRAVGQLLNTFGAADPETQAAARDVEADLDYLRWLRVGKTELR
jgi:hypothetical protein